MRIGLERLIDAELATGVEECRELNAVSGAKRVRIPSLTRGPRKGYNRRAPGSPARLLPPDRRLPSSSPRVLDGGCR
jgi:hypothetical protein